MHNKLESSPDPTPGLWKNCLPWNWTLIPKWLGTTGLKDSKQVVMSVSVVCVCPDCIYYALPTPGEEGITLAAVPPPARPAPLESRQNAHSSELVDAQGASFCWEARVVLSPWKCYSKSWHQVCFIQVGAHEKEQMAWTRALPISSWSVNICPREQCVLRSPRRPASQPNRKSPFLSFVSP